MSSWPSHMHMPVHQCWPHPLAAGSHAAQQSSPSKLSYGDIKQIRPARTPGPRFSA